MLSRSAFRSRSQQLERTRMLLQIRSVSSTSSKSLAILRGTALATLAFVSGTLITVYYFDSRSAIHRYLFTPLLRHLLDPEVSHKVAIKVLKSGLAPKDIELDDGRLSTQLWGEALSNPVGLAAGFDKNGEAIDGLFNLGFGWVEIGSVTPKPQTGNPRPRLFHLAEDLALINRYGFPSDGATSVLARLRARLPKFYSDSTLSTRESHASLRTDALLAVNLGKNKTSPQDSISDFINGVKLFGPVADVLVVNVSSPNTPGLRSLQSRSTLEELLARITAERDALVSSNQRTSNRKPRIVLKVAPDLTDDEVKDIANAVIANVGVDGVIVSNTTIRRPPGLLNENKVESGGLSGPPLKHLTLRVLRTLRAHLPASVPLIGCGGITSGKDALEYAQAGASAVQIYTTFGYDGVGACRRIKDEITEELTNMGTTWNEVVQKAVKELSLKEPPHTFELKPDAARENAEGKNPESLKALLDEGLSIMQRLIDLENRLRRDTVVEASGTPPWSVPQ